MLMIVAMSLVLILVIAICVIFSILIIGTICIKWYDYAITPSLVPRRTLHIVVLQLQPWKIIGTWKVPHPLWHAVWIIVFGLITQSKRLQLFRCPTTSKSFDFAATNGKTKARFPLPELTGRADGPSTRLVETPARQHGPCWRVMKTGHPSTRAVNSGRQLG